ncbi:hypothetical protein LXN57_32730 [Actinoplanes sp. TRM88002]|uniref:Fibronectin type-III domain-containing protein n=2 Tax=Paractinoplanes hotanensis TaxID=2906497 RepID=A0ABT0Y8G5_9ACTN|nr:hypothetical protein [Actinoplanes hotanensis]
MLEQAVELGKINLSEDDPDVLLTGFELGRVLQQSDDPMAARRVLEEAYAAGQWRLGDSDPLMLQISHDIGVVAEELGNRHEARKAFSRVAELGPGALGAGHWAVARARAYLGPDQLDVRGKSAAPVGDAPTTVFEAVPPEPRRGEVLPPSDANQQVWTAPEMVSGPRRAPVEQPTIAQPAIDPRSGSSAPYPHNRQIPAQRSEAIQPTTPATQGTPFSATAHPSTRPDPSTAPGTPAYPGAPVTGVATPASESNRLRPGASGNEAAPPHPNAPASGGAFHSAPPVGPFYPDDGGYAGPPYGDPAHPGVPSSGGPYPGTLRGEPAYPGAPGSGGPYATMPGEPYPHGSGYPEAPGAGQVFAPAYPSGGSGPYVQASDSPAGRKGLGVFAAVAAVLAAVIAVAALVFVLASRTSDSSDNDNVPTLAGPAPTDVRLRDTGATVGVTWTDPTRATVSFMVIMGRPAQELKPVGTVGPGQTSFEMTGLNATVNYCFAVVAVYSGNQFATSPQACTSRASATPR